MHHPSSVRGRFTQALIVSVGIILVFLATWYFVARSVQGLTIGTGFRVSATSGPAPLPVTVTHTDYQFAPEAAIEVDFGDGTVVKNPEGDNRGSVKITTVKHTYAKQGQYDLVMTKRTPVPGSSASSSAETVQTVHSAITVSAPEPLEFYLYPAQGHAPLPIYAGLVDYHLFPDMQVRFDFGDGTVIDTSKVEARNYGSVQYLSARHSYLRPGLYTATATLSSPSIGFSQSATQNVIVDDQDGISFLAQLDNPKQPLTATVIAKDSDRYCDGSPITGCKGLNWIFSDGTTIADAPFTVTHQFPKAGTYKITLELKGTLRSEKFFTVDGKGGLVEVKSPIATSPGMPKLTELRVNGNAVALSSNLAVSLGDIVQLRGTGTAGAIVRGIVTTKPDFAILTESVIEHTDQFLVNPEGQWVWQPLSFLPPVAGTFTLYLDEATGNNRQQVLVVTVTKPAPAASATTAAKKGTSSASGVTTNQAEIIPTAVQPTGFKGTLVATGSNLPLMLLLSLLVASAASYFILRHPLSFNPHAKVHD